MSYNLERTLNCLLISRDIENEEQICLNFTNNANCLTQTSEIKMNHCYMKWTVCIVGGEILKLNKQSRTLFLFLAHSGPIIHLWQKER